MRLTQGCFSFLPDLTDQQIEKQVNYAMSKGWAMNVEWTDDPHPRNNYWELWGLPLFDIKDVASVMFEFNMSFCNFSRSISQPLGIFILP